MSDDLKERLRRHTVSGRVNHVSKADRLAAADRIAALEKALEECKTTSLDMANRTINIWHLARAICTIVERANGHSNPADKHD